MYKLEFKGYRIREIHFHNMPDAPNFQMEHTCNYQVQYGADNRCNAEMTVECHRKDCPEQFSLRMVIVGFFSWQGDREKPQLHADTFRELYPYARAAVSNLTVTAGLPPIILPAIDIESQAIYRIENQPK